MNQGNGIDSVLLTIIIVNWNTRDDLIGCLKSVQDNLETVRYEVIVVDNGSVDGSVETVQQMFPAVTVIANRRNEGFAKAANQAMRKMRGRYALLLNPDARIQKGSIEKLISFMEERPDAGAAGPQLLNEDGSRQNCIANFPSLATELLNKRLLRFLLPKIFPGKEKGYREPVEVDSVIGACMIVRGQAARQIGLFDESYFLFLEETDLCYRMKREGWKVFHVPGAEIVHFQGRSAEAHKSRAKLEYYRSRYTFFRKRRGDFHYFVLLAGSVLKLTGEVAIMCIACAVTLFLKRTWRKKLSVYLYLLLWHLRFCPEGMGLR